MVFEYTWDNNEANFGAPIRKEVGGGTHITCEVVLKKGEEYIALRRKSIPGHESPPKLDKNPDGLLFFCHNLIRYGESIKQCVARIVKEQTGVDVMDFKVVDIETVIMEESGGKKLKQWAIVPHIIVELEKIPEKGNYGNEIIEVVRFKKDNIPDDFAWWTKEDLKEFLDKFD